jgi:hypothetical protein
MKYNPDAKRPSFNLPPGEYPAEIIKAEETTSKAGNPMLVVELKAFDVATGRPRVIKDYIVLGGEYSADWKIKNLCQSTGVGVSGDLVPAELNGLACKVKVKIKPATGQYEESNTIADYLEHDAEATKAAIPAPADSEIPF